MLILAKYKLLVEERPNLLNEWDYEKNNTLGIYPDKLSYSSNLYVWWKCNKGHSWNTMVCTRTLDKCGCPICSNKKVLVGYNDLASQQPQLVEEWDFDKNGDLLPSQVVVSSQKKVWWKCLNCGHDWLEPAYVRKKKHKCSHCKKQFIEEVNI